MNADMSLVALFANASLVVKLVMLLLLIASVYAWTVILYKWRVLRRAKEEADAFEHRFWSGIDLVELYRQISKRSDQSSGMER
ncbi:MAG TPA: hypothetical protein VKA64_02760, partial [Gammaproteobacteria bacterium]|nr:hypothetical protein [Gammaproteobacteria bacterium]